MVHPLKYFALPFLLATIVVSRRLRAGANDAAGASANHPARHVSTSAFKGCAQATSQSTATRLNRPNGRVLLVRGAESI